MQRADVIKMQVSVTDLPSAVSCILGWADEAAGGRSVCVSNVHMCMEMMDSDDFRVVVNSADMVVADGKPIQLAQRLLGHPEAAQVRGMDLTLSLCEAASRRGMAVGFYGGQENVLRDMVGQLRTSFPGLAVSYVHSPPFRALTAEEDAAIVSAINDSGVKILFVGLGCPKQEVWMSRHRDSLHCVMLGVGAAFDFIAGHKKHAPKWMQAMALEWLFRLLSEPRRLWARYLKHNPRFVWYFLQQWLLGRKFT